ncbi:MAG: glycosyltransferase family 4 protein [Candidatus Bilamarchaeaceae archaeon]
MELKTWEGLLKKISMIFVEEYYEKNIVKDAIVSILLAPFKNYPFIALTKRTYNFLKKRRFKVFFIPPAEKRRKINKKREYILFVGRLCKSKNPELIISLAREIKNENFLVIGKGEFSDLIKKASQELKNLKYIEYVEEREKLFEYYANAKILLHPALSDPVGFVVVEALSTSTPVLVSSSTGVADFLPKDWVIDKPDVQKWIEKIEQMTRNLDKNIKLAESTFENEHLNLDDRYFDEIAKGIEKQQNSFLPTHSIYQ